MIMWRACTATMVWYGYFLSISQQAVSADITKIQLSIILCNILIMNIDINIFTIIEKDVKNVSERKLPIYQP